MEVINWDRSTKKIMGWYSFSLQNQGIIKTKPDINPKKETAPLFL
jgi:hypothetical protein